MTRIKIERGIPVPQRNSMAKSKWEVILNKMSVGDSFVLKKKSGLNYILKVAKGINILITSRSYGDKRRIWRLR